MKFNIDKKHISIGITAFLVIAASICFYYLIFHNDSFLSKIHSFIVIASPVIYGIVVAYLLTPIVNGLESKVLTPIFTQNSGINDKKRKYMRIISVAFTMVLLIFIIYGFFSILIPNIIKSINSITYQFPYYVKNLTYWADKFLTNNPEIEKLVIQVVNIYSEELSSYLNNSFIPQLEAVLKTVSLSLINVLGVLWDFIIGLIIAIYVLFSKETFTCQSKKIVYAIFSAKNANHLLRDVRFVSDTFLGFISGKIIDSAIIGVLCFAGTRLLQMPYALLVSVIVGVTNIIPFFGPYLGAIPCAILILMVDPVKCIYFVIFIIILQQIDGNLIGPTILGESTGLSAFWIIFSITIFGGLLGVPGMIIGVPFFAVIYAAVRHFVDSRLAKKGLPTETKVYLDVEKVENNTLIPKENSKPKKFFRLSFKKKNDKKDNEKGGEQ